MQKSFHVTTVPRFPIVCGLLEGTLALELGLSWLKHVHLYEPETKLSKEWINEAFQVDAKGSWFFSETFQFHVSNLSALPDG